MAVLQELRQKLAEAMRQQMENAKRLGQPLVRLDGLAPNPALKELNRQLTAMQAEVNGADMIVRLEIDVERLFPDLQRALAGQVQVADESRSGERNLKELARAFEEYRKDHGHYPPAVVHGKGGQPLYSWRVALLPYLGEKELFDKFDKEKPWDHPTNLALLNEMPKVFAHPLMVTTPPVGTCFQLLTGPKALFEKDRRVTRADLAGREGQTILLVIHHQPVGWTEPRDVLVPEDATEVQAKVLSQLGLPGGDTFPAALFDGSIRQLKRDDVSGFLRSLHLANGAR